MCFSYFVVPNSDEEEEEEEEGGCGLGCPGNLRPLTVMNVPFQPRLLQVVGPNDPFHFTKTESDLLLKSF